MESSQFAAPLEVDEAVRLLSADPSARVLAGGTDLLVQTRLGAEPPSTFVDIKRIPRLRACELTQQGLVLGAAVPAAEIFENAEIRKRWPGLAEATDLIGSTQIQGRATWCGNLCNASPAADAVPALIACDASVVIAGPSGERGVAVTDFTTGPGTTILESGELVIEFRVPDPAPRAADAYLRMIPRTEMDIAVASAAVHVELDANDQIASARVVLGAVAPTAIRSESAEAALQGSKCESEALERAARAASETAQPIDDRRGTAEYRKKVAGVMTKRAAVIAYERAQQRSSS